MWRHPYSVFSTISSPPQPSNGLPISLPLTNTDVTLVEVMVPVLKDEGVKRVNPSIPHNRILIGLVFLFTQYRPNEATDHIQAF